jgi:hypothetical protein|tara:strand:+ start:3344 stop:4291 length:948 start_codon:yes stop_codon:yes gene_type:complete
MVPNKRFKRNNVKTLTARIFSKILYKINFSNKKGNQQLLGIDLLKVEVQKELLSITVLKVEETYIKLLQTGVAKETMQREGKFLFLQCIKKSCEDFLTKKYGYRVNVNLEILKNSLYTKNLLKDIELIFQVPFYVLIDPQSPAFRLIYYPIYNFASESFIEALIDHMILEISNCVVYFSIVNFSSVYAFRQTLYRSKFLSLRNFERFKNNLNWQLVTKNYVQRPIDLYNNRYQILILRTNGIYCRTIYANRSKEITYLSNFSLLTLILIELRDFLTSRLDEAIYFVSKGVRFTLTSVFGQVIGLIWRGVIEGLKK